MTFIKGHTPWNKNKPWSEEIKRKVSQSKKGKPSNSSTKFKKGRVSPNKGKKLLWITGKKNPNYKKLGNLHPCWKEKKITPLTKQIRFCFKYRQWRSDIFTRDNFTCVICGAKGIYLEADHYPKTFSTIFHEYKIKSLEEALSCEEFWSINNGRTVCKPHNPRGRKIKNFSQVD